MVRHVYEEVECIICLESFDSTQRSALKCSHNVCTACFGKHLDIAINDNCAGFPTCPHPDCYTFASDKLISSHVDEQTAARMRYLRVLHPTRRDDGKRMWCTAPGCYEPLPPPTLTDPNTSECPRCSTNSSLLSVLEDTVADAQFKKYTRTAGSIAECPRCGVHFELAGGCKRVTCAHCNHTFQFRSINTQRQRPVIASSPRSDRTTQPLVTLHASVTPARITRSLSSKSTDSVDSSTTSAKEQTAQILERVRAARLERERAQSAQRPVTVSATSPRNSPTTGNSPVRLLSPPPSSDDTGDEFGIMARIDDLRAQRYNPDSSSPRRLKSVPSVFANESVQERKSIFDEETVRAPAPARTPGRLRRMVGRVVDRNYTRPSNRNIGPVSSFTRTSSTASARPRRFQSSYVSASRYNDDRFDILSDRTSIVHG